MDGLLATGQQTKNATPFAVGAHRILDVYDGRAAMADFGPLLKQAGQLSSRAEQRQPRPTQKIHTVLAQFRNKTINTLALTLLGTRQKNILA